MKKAVILFTLLGQFSTLFAGGLVTNTNQSAMFTRFQCRDATLDIDAAFYNPAGLVHLSDGFYVSLNNQTMGQLKMITSDYSNLGDDQREYTGRVGVPMFPSIYGVYKTGHFAFSVGVNPVAGDGKANYENGLPSYEMGLADYVPVLRDRLATVDAAVTDITSTDPLYSNITGYDINVSIESRSLSMGYQANVAYQLNDYLSVAAGARLVHSRNWIRGTVTDLRIVGTNSSGDFSVSPDNYLRTVASTYESIDDTSAVAIATVNFLNTIADEIEIKSSVEAEVIRSGFGITPIISINYAPSLMTNWSFKYEFRTNLDLESRIVDGKDANGRYVDGTITISDIPAMLSIGLTRRPGPRFMFYTGIHYYFDKPIDFDGSEDISIDMIDNNSYEFAFGAEYLVNSTFRISSGWLLSRPGVNASYQSEQRYALPSNTIGTGVGVRLSPLIDLNIGGSYTLYKKGEKDYRYDPEDGVNSAVDVTEYYDTRKWIISVGIDFLFGEN